MKLIVTWHVKTYEKRKRSLSKFFFIKWDFFVWKK